MKNHIDMLIFHTHNLCRSVTNCYDGRREFEIRVAPSRKRSGTENSMINFEEELAKYEPSPNVEQVEDLVNNNNLTDLTDIVKELISEAKVSVSL